MHKLRQLLTAFGDLIIAASIAIDPFIQQLLSYVDCNVALDDVQATLPRTNYFEGHGQVFSTGAPEGGNIGESIEPRLQAAVNEGLFGSPYAVAAECMSDNCTFPGSYATVGYCSKRE